MKARMKILSFLLMSRISYPDTPNNYQFDVSAICKEIKATYVTTWKELDILWKKGYVVKLKKKKGSRVIIHYEVKEESVKVFDKTPKKWVLDFLRDVVEW